MVLFTLAMLGLVLTVVCAPLVLSAMGVRQYRWWRGQQRLE